MTNRWQSRGVVMERVKKKGYKRCITCFSVQNLCFVSQPTHRSGDILCEIRFFTHSNDQSNETYILFIFEQLRSFLLTWGIAAFMILGSVFDMTLHRESHRITDTDEHARDFLLLRGILKSVKTFRPWLILKLYILAGNLYTGRASRGCITLKEHPPSLQWKRVNLRSIHVEYTAIKRGT